jgi:hypothetical protein
VTPSALFDLVAWSRSVACISTIVRGAMKPPEVRPRFAALVGRLRGRGPHILLVVAFLGLATMFFTNRDKALAYEPNQDALRGDGKYRPVLARGDGHMMFLMMRSIVLDHDLRFKNDLSAFGDPWSQPTTPTGYTDIPHPIGPPLVWTPFFVLAHGTSKLLNVFGAAIPQHGYTLFHQRFTFFSSILFAFGACVLGYRVARRYVGGPWAAVFAAIAIAYGTSVTYYMTYMPSYGHAMDAGISGGFLGLWALSFGDRRWRRFVALGLLLGVAALVRAQEMMLGVVVAFELVWLAVAAWREPEAGKPLLRTLAELAARGALALALALAVFSIQMIVWKIIYGSYFITPNGRTYVRYSHPLFLEVLFAAKNGWFSTTPLAYAGVVGLFFMPRRARAIQVGFLLALVIQVYLNACIFDWWGSAAYGQRRLCSMTLVLVVGLAALCAAISRGVARWRVPRAAQLVPAMVVFGWFMAWNCGVIYLLRGGEAAGQEPGHMPLPHWARGWGSKLHRRIGNPFTFPASVIFALRHDVEPRRWERIVGNYVYVPPHDQRNDGRYLGSQNTWNLAGPNGTDWIIGGFGKSQHDARGDFRVITAAKARGMVPILMPDPQRFTVPLLPMNPGETVHVKLTWNGATVLEDDVPPAGKRLQFDAEVEVGQNEIGIETTPGALRMGPMVVGFVAKPPPPQPPPGAPSTNTK